ncbi:hypothetical protein [Mycobacterium sp. D16Q16]|uniref:hypothetical protein n=1 Tax=Mycobacterium sp. D16Q16 TaxID=1855659 RepID=UPI0009936C29|nr:hypothetical protein [Mycobacterium sp. D16Q16]
MTSSLDIATAALHDLIVSAKAEATDTTDPYLTVLTRWIDVLPKVREVLSVMDIHESTLGEIEYIYREAVTSWLRGDEPASLLADDPGTAALLADDELEQKIRVALDPPEVWIF